VQHSERGGVGSGDGDGIGASPRLAFSLGCTAAVEPSGVGLFSGLAFSFSGAVASEGVGARVTLGLTRNARIAVSPVMPPRNLSWRLSVLKFAGTSKTILPAFVIPGLI